MQESWCRIAEVRQERENWAERIEQTLDVIDQTWQVNNRF
jgi:hypothetical protein